MGIVHLANRSEGSFAIYIDTLLKHAPSYIHLHRLIVRVHTDLGAFTKHHALGTRLILPVCLNLGYNLVHTIDRHGIFVIMVTFNIKVIKIAIREIPQMDGVFHVRLHFHPFIIFSLEMSCHLHIGGVLRSIFELIM